MRTSTTGPAPPARSGPDPGRTAQRRTWLALALMPVGFVAAMVLGEFLLDVQGYDPASESPPLLATLIAGVPAMLVLAAPGLAAFWFGRSAERLGRPHGRTLAIVGGCIAAGWILLNLLGLVFS